MVFKAKAALDFLLGVAAGTRKFIHSFQDGCFTFLSITFSPSLSPSFCFKAFLFFLFVLFSFFCRGEGIVPFRNRKGWAMVKCLGMLPTL